MFQDHGHRYYPSLSRLVKRRTNYRQFHLSLDKICSAVPSLDALTLFRHCEPYERADGRTDGGSFNKTDMVRIWQRLSGKLNHLSELSLHLQGLFEPGRYNEADPHRTAHNGGDRSYTVIQQCDSWNSTNSGFTVTMDELVETERALRMEAPRPEESFWKRRFQQLINLYIKGLPVRGEWTRFGLHATH